MTYDGYLAFGGNEIANNARTKGYAETAKCPMYWFKGEVCAGLYDALGETNLYTYANITSAPWYDSVNEESTRFFGVYVIDVDGLENSTRSVSVTEGVGHGGVLGPTRKAVKTVKMKALLVGEGRDALEYGMAWLSSVLDPGTCGQHGQGCGTVDLAFFAECPPTRASVTMPETSWSEPITNLATNPSFEKGAATVTVRTNLATNPSFEQVTAATVEVRRNLAIRPNPVGTAGTAGSGGWASNNGGQYPFTIDNTFVHTPGIPSVKATRLVDFSNNTLSSAYAVGATAYSNAGASPVTSGQTYTFSLWLAASVANCSAILNITWWDAAGVQVGTMVSATEATPTSHPANTWWRFQMTATAPAGAVAARLGSVTNLPVGQFSTGNELSWITEALFENTPSSVTTPREWFSGAKAAAGDFSYAWTGTVDASASAQYGIQVPSVGGHPTTGDRVVSSTEWASSGAKSARLTILGNHQDSFMELPSVWLGAFTPGRQITLLAKVRLTAPMGGAGSSGTRTRQLMMSVTGVGEVGSTQFPNVPGVHEIRWTYTFPAATSGVGFFRLYSGHTSGDLWLDDLLIVDGAYTGPYFDGANPAKMRRNLALNPAAANTTNFSMAGSGNATHTTTIDSAFSHSGGQSLKRVMTSDGFTSALMRAPGAMPPGGQVSFSFWIYTTRAGKITLYAEGDKNGGYAGAGGGSGMQPDIPANVWTKCSGTVTMPADGNLTGWRFGGYGLPVLNGDTVWFDEFVIESGPVVGEYFDGRTAIAPYAAGWEGAADASPSYLTDPDFTTVWTGTPNASTSVQNGIAVADVSVGGGGPRVLIQSTHWKTDRTKSMRIIPTGTLNDTAASPGGDTGGMRLGMVAGKTYTALAVTRLEAPTSNPAPGQFIVFYKIGAGSYQTFPGPAIPNEAGVYDRRLTFTLPAGATEAFVRLYAGTASGGGDVWWDEFALVEGDYPGDYFDGEFPDSLPADFEVYGKTVVEYAWTGTPDASTSTYTTGTILAVEDPVEWLAQTTDLVRYLHDTGAVSGPLVTGEFESAGFFANQVEVTFTSERPWVFKVTKPIALPPSLPVVVQDIPFNLAPYPSAELSSGTVIVAKNFVVNPSVEVDISGWVASGTVPTHAISRSTELASNGAASAKSLITTSASGSGGYTWVEQLVDLTGITPQTRYSFNVWGSASVQSGTAELGYIEMVAVWWNGTTYLGETPLAAVPATGGPLSAKSVLPMAGTNKVTVRVRLGVVSWTAGAIIRLYADALAVTVP